MTKPLSYDPADNMAFLKVRVMNRMKEAGLKFKSPEEANQKFSNLWRH
jgi:hypothetical protein